MKVILWIVLFITSFGFIQGQEIFDGEATCVTPNNDVGVCVDVRQCTIFINAIRSEKRECYAFLRESQCGSEDESPKVCCGKYDNYIHHETTITKPLVPSKPSPLPKMCGNDTTSLERIVGGAEANLGEFPWMARLRHLRSDSLLSYGCAGFLISEKFVLTAAHCINSTALARLGPIYQVQLGEHNTDTDPDCGGFPRECADPPQFLRTAEPILHPYYSNNKQYHHDIAVIPLIEPATLTSYVNTICLPDTPSNHNYFWVSGWGKTEIASRSTIKLSVVVPKADQNRCSSLYKTRGVELLSTQLCVGGVTGKDSCTGDSGGPLMTIRNNSWYAEGIVSIGKGCGEKGWPGVYTYLPNYLVWIEFVMREYLEKHSEEED